MNEELNGRGPCRSFDNLHTTCLFPIEKLGTMAATAVLNPCKRPAELDLITEVLLFTVVSFVCTCRPVHLGHAIHSAANDGRRAAHLLADHNGQRGSRNR